MPKVADSFREVYGLDLDEADLPKPGAIRSWIGGTATAIRSSNRIAFVTRWNSRAT